MRADGVTRIDNAPLREAFLRLGVPQCELARRLGWERRMSPAHRRRWPNGPERIPDDTRIRAALGLRACAPSRGGKHPTRQQTVPYDTALAICRALDLDPIDVGL